MPPRDRVAIDSGARFLYRVRPANLLVDALVVVELDPEILVDAPLPDRVVVLEVNVDYLEAKERVNENGKGAIIARLARVNHQAMRVRMANGKCSRSR